MTGPTPLGATKASYDAVAAEYAETFGNELDTKPLDRAMLSAFAELVQGAGTRRVVDIGCGPGHVTAHLCDLGLDASGMDLSSEMVATATRTYPDVRFEEGDMRAVSLDDGVLGGLVAFYSIIHIPTEELSGVFREFHRIVVSGGYLLLAFQAGDDHLQRSEWFGHAVSLDAYLRKPQQIAELLEDVGLIVEARLLRQPIPGQETSERAYLMIRKPLEGGNTRD